MGGGVIGKHCDLSESRSLCAMAGIARSGLSYVVSSGYSDAIGRGLRSSATVPNEPSDNATVLDVSKNFGILPARYDFAIRFEARLCEGYPRD